jgi:hypothetical protein
MKKLAARIVASYSKNTEQNLNNTSRVMSVPKHTTPAAKEVTVPV